MELNSSEPLTQLITLLGVENWEDLTAFVKQIPYGRNTNRTDFSLVIKENKGTCSSKHAFLKQIADENKIENIRLIVGIFKMSKENTPKTGTILEDNSLVYIPEAHCYLKINGQPMDFTNKDSLYNKIKNDILEEIEIDPFQVSEFKVNFHKEYLKKWLSKVNSVMTFEQVWEIRENCIQNLSE
ncbi:MAG TPA: hypothetical protein VF677_14185 [Flavobacterium sp.]|jgi:hypothetical protein